jgi:cytochrome P450
MVLALFTIFLGYFLYTKIKSHKDDNDRTLPPLPKPDEKKTKILLSKLRGEPEDWDLFNDSTIREKALTKMVEKNGKTFLMYCQGDVKNALGASPVIATADPNLVKEIFLKKSHTLRRPRRMLLAQNLPGLDGVLFQDGPKWDKHSRTLKPVFHAKNFTLFTNKMREETDKQVDIWSKVTSKDKSSVHHLGNGYISTLTSLRHLSTSMALHVGYGIDPESKDGIDLREALDGYDEKKRFRAAGKNICLLIRALFLVWMDAKKIKNVVQRIVSKMKSNNNTTSNEEKERKEKNDENNTTQPLSWIRQMVDANFTVHEISNEVGHLHHAHKAIAYMTSFALYELGKHPIWQEKIRNEFDRVLVDGRSPEKKDLSSLVHCTSVWKETLRLHPISLGVIREVGSDVETSLNNETVTIPKGTMVSILLYALHMDKEQWNNPETFNPNRWIDADNTSAQSTMSDKGIRSSFVPFLDGKRQCEGRFLAELEFIIFLWSLLQNYDVIVPDDYTFTIGPDFFPDATTPIPIKLKRRNTT